MGKNFVLFNINDHFRVKLTKFGVDILLKEKVYNKMLLEEAESNNGWVEMQAWQVMQKFGEYLAMAQEPFEIVIGVEYKLTHPESKTTDLNFWEAYQAMKRGEWVGNDGIAWADYFYIDGDVIYGRYAKAERFTDDLDIQSLLDTDNWYIVPKPPRYKVGDRFSIEIFGEEFIREIVYVDDASGDCSVRKTRNGQPYGLEVCTFDELSQYKRI